MASNDSIGSRNPDPCSENQDLDLDTECEVIQILILLSKIPAETDVWTDKLMDQLCTLCDMMSDVNIRDLVLDNNILSLVLTIIDTNNLRDLPRLVELVTCVINNLCCYESNQTQIARHPELFHSFVKLFITSENPLDNPLDLLEIIRLFTTITQSTDDSMIEILEAILPSFMNNTQGLKRLGYILYTSTNCELLRATLELVKLWCLMPGDMQDGATSVTFSQYMVSADLIQGLLEMIDHFDTYDSLQAGDANGFATILTEFSSSPAGTTALMAYKLQILEILTKLLTNFYNVILSNVVTVSLVIIKEGYKKTEEYVLYALFSKLMCISEILMKSDSDKTWDDWTTQDSEVDPDTLLDSSSLLGYISDFFKSLLVWNLEQGNVASVALQNLVQTNINKIVSGNS